MTTFIVTRPAHQATPLLASIRALGVDAISAPAIEIHKTNSSVPETFADAWIFVSPNAVQFANQQMSTEQWRLLQNAEVYAVGSATAKALNQYNISRVNFPENASSEALLALISPQKVKNKRIIYVCGEGGRDVIETTLNEYQANVTRWEVYRRTTSSTLHAFWQQNGSKYQSAIWIVTSETALRSIAEKVNANVNIMVSSDRLKNTATALGFTVVAQAEDATNDAILHTIRSVIA